MRLALVSTSLAAYHFSGANADRLPGYRHYWQQDKVRGVVKDARGTPVADVTVSVKGSTRSTVTAADGS